MAPDVKSTLNAINRSKATGKKVVAMKPLAAGLLKPTKAFEYLKDKVDGLAVGITSSQELNEVIETGEKYFQN